MSKTHKIKPQKFGRIAPAEKDSVSYPSLYLSLKDIPQAKDWKVGSTYMLELKVRQSSMTQTKDGAGNVSFEILEVSGETAEEEVQEEKAVKKYNRSNK